jgi:hypothetical protein
MLRAMRSLGMEYKHRKLVGHIDSHIISKTEGDGKMNFEEFLDIVAHNLVVFAVACFNCFGADH